MRSLIRGSALMGPPPIDRLTVPTRAHLYESPAQGGAHTGMLGASGLTVPDDPWIDWVGGGLRLRIRYFRTGPVGVQD